MRIAGASGVPVFFDVNVRPSLWSDPGEAAEICYDVARQSDVVKLSLDDAVALMGQAATVESAVERFLALGPDVVVVTDGERGCWFATRIRPQPRFVPAFVVEAVEPTGAGDAFGAALIARSLENNWQSPEFDDIRYAAAAGALATTRRGAWEAYPVVANCRHFSPHNQPKRSPHSRG